MNIVKFFAYIDKALPNAYFSPPMDGVIHAYDSRHKIDLPDIEQPQCYIGYIDLMGIFCIRKEYECSKQITDQLKEINVTSI